MCGICGVVQLGGGPRGRVIEPSVLDAMTDLMIHRGPSDRGTYMADGVAFGVRRLSIVDVDGGHQPFSNEDGTIWAIQNGELFNHADIRRKLTGHKLRSRCDTEVIAHLYEDLGDEFPHKLRGMFSIALWDGTRRRLVLARDRMGIKPLYYSVAGDTLVFASELKCVIASGLVDPDLDPGSIDAYLTLGYFPTPYTPMARVRKLPPGHLLVVDEGRVTVKRYWAYPNREARPMGMAEAAERVLDKLDESVRLRLMSDVPLGAVLSGGLDSSLIVALMARQMSRPVTTFTVGFREDADNELADARTFARSLGTEHHEVELSLVRDSVQTDELAWFLDEPLADLSSIGFYALSQLASQHVTVALSGQGADELFGGYAAHRNAVAVAALHGVPGGRRLARFAEPLLPRDARRVAQLLSAHSATERFIAQQGLTSDAARRDLFTEDFVLVPGQRAREVIDGHLEDLPDRPLRTALQLHAKLALVDDMLMYFDRASMAHSLEVRVPFLDHELVELAATIPDTLKVRRFMTKAVLRRAARDLVPESIIRRRKVGFFNALMGQWIDARGRAELVERVIDADGATAAFLDRGALQRLVLDPRAAADRPRLLVAILMLELWLSSVLPKALAAGAAARGKAA